MTENFILTCESTVNLPYAYIAKRNIPVLFYSYNIDGVDYEEDMFKSEKKLSEFYKKIENGALPKTSQLNSFNYSEFFEPLLEKGNILHIAFGSGMTQSVNNASFAANELMEKYPDKKITVIDSTSSCAGYGLLVDYAADMRDGGKSLEETAKWVEENKRKVHHQFFCTDLKFFKRSGRVSGTAAAVATVLGICPIMHLNYDGKIVAYSKARGKKSAIETTVNEMSAHAQNGKNYNGKCYLVHSHNLADANETKARIESTFKNLKGKIKVIEIGEIIASHCGIGTVAVFFLGDERQN